MAHSMRKYISNRGSALFMVISTMTALMITCMAMYFTVMSSQSAGYAVFYQEQSYQSAISITDMVIAGINGNQDLLNAMDGLSEGQILTTDGNGFKSLNSAATGDDDLLIGGYSVTVTRLKDETVAGGKTAKVFDISVTTSVKGVKEVTHSIIQAVEQEKGGGGGGGNLDLFASTGCLPNDTSLDCGVFYMDTVFDNEYAILHTYEPNNCAQFTGDVICGGSLTTVNNVEAGDAAATRPVVWAIRNNFTRTVSNMPIGFAPGSEVFVGGDLRFAVPYDGGLKNADVYVNGNLYVCGNDLTSCRYFVNGDVIVEGSGWSSIGTDFYCNGSVINKSNGGGINGLGNVKPWNSSAPGRSLTEAMTELDSRTQSKVYPKWEINSNDRSADGYIKELDESSSSANHQSIYFDFMDTSKAIQTIKCFDSTWKNGCIIDKVSMSDGANYTNATLIIDTGEDPDAVYTIRVKPYLDNDGDGKKESFSWYPQRLWNSSKDIKVLVKGRGSVVIDVPEGCIYQDHRQSMISHYNWYILQGGGDNGSGALKSIKSDAPLMYSFVHTKCGAGCGCVYNPHSGLEKCEKCGNYKKAYTCTVHEYTEEHCETCEPHFTTEGMCKDRVDRQAIDAYLATHPAIKNQMEKDSHGKIIYPTVNIFLVSVDEAADFRFTDDIMGDKIIDNSFFGFIYAPYMTYKAYGQRASGGQVRLMGGLTVSDYIIEDSAGYVTCWPDASIFDVMRNTGWQGDYIEPEKSWKISLVSR